MGNEYKNKVGFVALRTSDTALTAAATDTARVNARLANFKSGIFGVHIITAAVDGTDEAYTYFLEGRPVAGTGDYETLASIVFAAAAATAGLHTANADRLMPDMRVRLAVAGATVSTKYNAWAAALDTTYVPEGAAVIND